MSVEDMKNAVVTFVNIAEEEVISKEFEELDKNGVEILKALDELEAYRAIGTVSEFRETMFFKKYFMELYGEGLEAANWHQNGDLEPLDNFIDEAVECGKQEECEEHE